MCNVAMICLWDRLPDEIQRKILHLKNKAELRDKDTFWYGFGERMKTIRHSNTVCRRMCKTRKESQPHYVLSNELMHLDSNFEEVMFKSYPRRLVCDMAWTVKGKSPIDIFYGDKDKHVDLTPAELVEELIAIQIHYDTFVRGTVHTGTMVYNGKTRKWVNNYYEKKIDASFAKINKLLFNTKM